MVCRSYGQDGSSIPILSHRVPLFLNASDRDRACPLSAPIDRPEREPSFSSLPHTQIVDDGAVCVGAHVDHTTFGSFACSHDDCTPAKIEVIELETCRLSHPQSASSMR